MVIQCWQASWGAGAGGVGRWGVFEFASGRCLQAGVVGRRGGGYWDASGMIIIPSIDREAAHDDGREFINFPVNLIHCNFLPLFN